MMDVSKTLAVQSWCLRSSKDSAKVIELYSTKKPEGHRAGEGVGAASH